MASCCVNLAIMSDEAAPFRAVLAPNRSLAPTGFVVLMLAIGLVSFVMGVTFMLIGAWPVFGFFGLDVGLVYLAFRLNYRSGRRSETIEIDGPCLTLTRVDPKGRSESFELNPYWVSVRLSHARNGRTRLALASHGRELAFGAFLTDDERVEFAALLRAALHAARGASYTGENSAS
jgi:uncharacterized membrane protein